MFSPMGKKKILLEQRIGGARRASFSAPDSEQELVPNDFAMSTKSRKTRVSTMDVGDSIASTTNLEKALADTGSTGMMMRKILESTIRYRPEKDAVILKAFQSKNIEYDKFRAYLYSSFWLGFEDDEFQSFLDYFDPQKDGILNGYDFMIAFTRLGAIRKSRESLAVREKQELFLVQQKEDEERRQLELEKKNELAADFSFTDEVRAAAVKKLHEAAFKFDPNHPACASPEAFNVNFLKPAVFKEMLKLTFNLKVDRAELGAILKEFDPNYESKDVPGSEFLRYFMRLGIDARDKARMEQRQKQIGFAAQVEQDNAKKLAEQEQKMNLDVDYNFSETAEENAKEKLRTASIKYDRYATGAVALDGFECESLEPGAFKDLLRRVFNIQLTSGELGYVIKKYDTKNTGRVVCKTFLTEFLRMGQDLRYQSHVEQLQRQRTMILTAELEHKKKIEAVQNSETIRISDRFLDKHLQSALAKLTEAAVRYDKVRGVSLISFEPANLSPLEFKKALKRTFNIKFTAQEMGAAVDYFDKDGSKTVHCQTFLSTFTILGAEKKGEVRAQQLKQQREDWARQAQEEEKKVVTLSSKVQYNVDFEFTDLDKEVAIEKMTAAAVKYDASHPAALGLDGFERKSMSAPEFKELVRRTFHLKLTGTEVGALFDFFNNSDAPEIDCKEFVRHFLHLGIAERNKVKKEQLDRQRREDREREEEHARKLFDAANRQTFTVDMNYTEEDKESIQQKINAASEGFDKSHPAAPSLEAFEVAYLSPGLFRENLKRVFNILATPKEIGFLMDEYDKTKIGKVDSKEFMIKFLATGKRIRDEKRKNFLEEQRLAHKNAIQEEERKTSALWDKAELLVDYDTTAADLKSAMEKMTEASFKYDKSHPSAPSLDGFSGGPIKAGVFRELVRRAFNIWFEPKELGAVVKRYPHEKLRNMVDGKVFLIAFMKLGYEARARNKATTLQKQRQDEMNRKHEAEMKLHMSAQRVAVDLDSNFTEEDIKAAMRKLTVASALYDKNSPGCVALDAFDAAFLTPGMFREVAKRTFNLVFEPKELSAMIAMYDNGKGNLDCSKFLVAFIRMGSEEREKAKIIQLGKQRQDDLLRKSDHERKIHELERKLIINVTYEYTDAQRDSAFRKLTVCAKRYDKNHPGAMSLEGFDEKTMKPHVFREMIKRTFGVVLDQPELNACMHFFDPKKTGLVPSRKFLIYFLKLGIAEREADHKRSMIKLRTDAAMREREHEEKLAAQWAKMELNLTYDFTPADRDSALEKLAHAAFKFDPSSPGPMGLVAFNGKKLSPAVFKEMLRRTFNMKVNAPELAALIAEFDKDGTKNIDCAEFMVRFTTLGFDRRSDLRTSQLARQRLMDESAQAEAIAKVRAADAKMEANLAMDFGNEDFNSALEKIRVIASNYDRSHASAPSLKGFTGTNMKPVEFKDMLMRTFKVTLTDKQLGAMVSIFGVERGDEDEQTFRNKNKETGVRIDNAEFLKYFNKIQRDEQAKRNRERIVKERELIESEKEYQLQLQNKKKEEDLKRLIYSEEDEVTLLEKIRHAAQEYAVDSALYMDGMQGFKGPALPSDKFRELFAKIFSIKMTYPEVGVLLSILDLGGVGTLDGTKFLNWFYKICRYEERFMLGESEEPVTFGTLKAASTMGPSGPTRAPPSRGGTAGKRQIKDKDGGNSVARSWANSSTEYMHSDGGSVSVDGNSLQSQSVYSVHSVRVNTADRSQGMSNNGPTGGKKSTNPLAPHHISSKYSLSFNEEDPFNSQQVHVNNAQSFTESTINKNWILPSISGASPSSKPGTANGFGFMASQSEDDPFEAAEEARRHLTHVFNFNDPGASRADTSKLFSSSAFLDDIDQGVAMEGEIFGFDGQLIAGSGAQRAPSRGAKPAKKGLNKHASAGSMKVPAGSTVSSDTEGKRSHLRTAPGKQQHPRRVPSEDLPDASVPSPHKQLLVPFDLSATMSTTSGSRQGTAVSTNNPRKRTASSSSPTQDLRAASPEELVDSSFDAPVSMSAKIPAKSSKSKSVKLLKPLPVSSSAVEAKKAEDVKFMQALFAPESQSPYAQMLKVPQRGPTSTTNKQKDPILRLKMANEHFHESPIAQMKLKRPAMFASTSLDSSAPAYIFNTLPVAGQRASSPPHAKHAGSPTRTKSKAQTAKAGEDSAKKAKKSTDGAGFFFPSLLASGTSASASAAETETDPEAAELDDAPVDPYSRYTSNKKLKQKQDTEGDGGEGQSAQQAHRLQISGVPDIGVVGASEVTEDDFAFLRSILL